jgi:hypothetical protein
MVQPLPEQLRSPLYSIIGAYVLRGLTALFTTIIKVDTASR